jgi:hypothetical protein
MSSRAGTHVLVDPRRQLVGRKLRAGPLVQAEELDDLLGALGKGELGPARQHRYRARAKRLQLGQAGRIFQNIHRNEVDPTDR